MDTIKIGNFLKELRKQKGLTQEQLGEKIGVTNKTVSRWETGNYLPPIECLKLLSDIYQVSINEILAGRNLDDNEYKDASEDNITITLKEMEREEKRFEKKMLLIMGITTVLAITVMILLPCGKDLPIAEKVKEIIVIALVWAMAILSNTLNIVAIVLRKKR